MNKKIIGISVALLFAATGAIAQTSVTMYGTVDAGVFYNKGTNNGSATTNGGKLFGVASGQQSYSRIGFKGTEDLGSGLKALFVLEQGVDISTGNSSYSTFGSDITGQNFFTGSSENRGTFSSQAFVGLSSNVAGTITVGRQFSPMYEAHGQIDPFQNGFAANINNFFGSIYNYSEYQRMDNAVIYHTPDSPSLAGFSGALAYGFGEVAGSTSQQAQIGVSLGYSNGPLTIAYAFHHANNDQADLGSFRTHFVGATWDLNVAKVHAAFDQNKLSDNSFKTIDYMLGVTVPFGTEHSVFGNWTHKKDQVYDDANSNQFALGYTYALSKRTNFYTAYSYVKNDANAIILTDTPGTSVNTFQVGMRHSF